MSEFIHLHNHSEYSMLDGACRIDDMINWAVKNSSPGMALTDHGVMHGCLEFYTKAKDAGINPIIGCEAYVAPENRHLKNKIHSKSYHLTLLAENKTGYYNLLKLVSLGYTEGFYGRPRIDMEILKTYNEGIIVLTGCIAGQVPQLISSQKETALKNFRQLISATQKGNLYVEIQNHFLEEELKAYPLMIELAKQFNLPIVGTNDVHYPSFGDHKLHDTMLCIQMKKTISNEDRICFQNQFYFKTHDEMKEVLHCYPEEAFTNTQVINDRCNIELELGQDLMPKFDIPQGYTEDSYLKKVCYNSLKKLYGSHLSSEIQERINHELEVIEKTGFAGYFLIVWDYVQHARNQGHFLSARGSAGSSLVLYAIGVINFNPMDYNCIFERFLNTERVSPPDIDIDFSDRARDCVIEYLRKKYGEESVAKVATFSTFNEKSAIADIGKALEIPVSEVRRIQKGQSDNSELTQLTESIDGMKRHVSSHASAFVVSSDPLTNHIPIFKDSHGEIVSQYEGKDVEKLGIVKFDLLTVSSITETQDCINLIKQNHGIDIKLEDIPLDNEKTYQLINRGLNTGLFQISKSSGMRKIVSRVNPQNFEEFAAISALYRPGPLESGMTDKYIKRKNGDEKITQIHPLLENALKETYGVCVYQEQVMQMAQDMAGFTLGEADVLRSAMGKVNKELLISQRQKFVEGAMKKGVLENEASQVFDFIVPFGSYAFNKSHTVAYSLLSYQMAYLKTHYPREFIAALMSGAQDDPNKLFEYRHESRALSEYLNVEINILPPDINKSSIKFSVEGPNIIFGLECLKGIGVSIIEEIISARNKKGKFKSLSDFCSKVDTSKVRKKGIEILIESGTFDSIEPNRKSAFERIEKTIKSTKAIQEDRQRGQMSLWGDEFDEKQIEEPVKETNVKDWNETEKLEREKKILGFYITGHPLEKYQNIIDRYTYTDTEKIKRSKKLGNAVFVGIISKIRKIQTRNKKTMIILTFQDTKGEVEGILFQGVKLNADIKENNIVWVSGVIEKDNDPISNKTTNQVKIDEILSIDKVIESKTTDIEVFIEEYNEEKLNTLRELSLKLKGNKTLYLSIPTQEGRSLIRASQKFNIDASENTLGRIRELFGSESITLSNKMITSKK